MLHASMLFWSCAVRALSFKVFLLAALCVAFTLQWTHRPCFAVQGPVYRAHVQVCLHFDFLLVGKSRQIIQWWNVALIFPLVGPRQRVQLKTTYIYFCCTFNNCHWPKCQQTKELVLNTKCVKKTVIKITEMHRDVRKVKKIWQDINRSPKIMQPMSAPSEYECVLKWDYDSVVYMKYTSKKCEEKKDTSV